MKPRAVVTPAEITVLAVIAIVTIVFLVDLRNYSSAARLVPSIFIAITLILLVGRAAMLVYQGVRNAPSTADIAEAPPASEEEPPNTARTFLVMGAVISYLCLIYLIGLYPAIPVYVFFFARMVGGVGWVQSAVVALGTGLAAFLIFDVVLGLSRLNGVLM